MSDCKLKYYTNTKNDFLNATSQFNHLRGTFKTTLPPNNEIKEDISNLTDCNIRKQFDQLPYLVGTPYKGKLYHGDTIIESDLFMSGLSDLDKKKTSLVSDGMYHNKHFYIFSDQITAPNALSSVETPDKGFKWGRVGQSTRF